MPLSCPQHNLKKEVASPPGSKQTWTETILLTKQGGLEEGSTSKTHLAMKAHQDIDLPPIQLKNPIDQPIGTLVGSRVL